MASGERLDKYIAAKIIGKSSMKTLSSTMIKSHNDSGAEKEHKWVVRYNDGQAEPDVPTAAIKIPRQVRQESEFGGGGDGQKSVKWKGMPVRFEFPVDIPTTWAMPMYREKATCITMSEEGTPAYFATGVIIPMDTTYVAGRGAISAAQAMKDEAEAAYRARRQEGEAPGREELMSHNDSCGMKLYIPTPARAVASDTLTLSRLHHHLAARGVQLVGGKKNAKPSRILDVDGDANKKRYVPPTFDDANPPFCRTCSKRVACHHYFAAKLKEQRRIAVYGVRTESQQGAGQPTTFANSEVHDGHAGDGDFGASGGRLGLVADSNDTLL